MTPRVDVHRVDLAAALAGVGARLDVITHVANCHLHFDHCGGNPLFDGRPVFIQATKLADATSVPDYTLPELLEGTRFEQLSGEAEVLDGVWLTPTPGHTSGHQSLIVRRADGTVILASDAGHSMSQAAGLARLGDESQYRMRSVTLCECSWQAGPGRWDGGWCPSWWPVPIR